MLQYGLKLFNYLLNKNHLVKQKALERISSNSFTFPPFSHGSEKFCFGGIVFSQESCIAMKNSNQTLEFRTKGNSRFLENLRNGLK